MDSILHGGNILHSHVRTVTANQSRQLCFRIRLSKLSWVNCDNNFLKQIVSPLGPLLIANVPRALNTRRTVSKPIKNCKVGLVFGFNEEICSRTCSNRERFQIVGKDLRFSMQLER